DFFAESAETKQALAIAKVGHNRGYVGLKTEALDPTRGEDSKEAFNIGYATDIDPANPPADRAFSGKVDTGFPSANAMKQ
ncbi:2-oxoglutarate and iron-dependent oxygenase domain-containing protein, partial [Acinetobacter baumannii]